MPETKTTRQSVQQLFDNGLISFWDYQHYIVTLPVMDEVNENRRKEVEESVNLKIVY